MSKPMMPSILAYCRAGYESDCAQELTEKANSLHCYGYATPQAGAGYCVFHVYQAEHADKLVNELSVADTIFPRQLFLVLGHLENIDKQDRIGPILRLLDADANADGNTKASAWGALWVEHADTEAGKQLAKFCRKFSVPLRQALRKKGYLLDTENTHKPLLHVFFTDFDSAYVGVSYPQSRAPFANGICRLKFPSAAPSRSTLKLEEAIKTMLSPEQYATIFTDHARAVDLGACPGGWTYQLVSREMHVEAVDNGDIDGALMATGQVMHQVSDGFTYKPLGGHVDLLVCDMIEQPDRVARLMATWLVKNYASHAIFNLKLPMKKRYQCVADALAEIDQALAQTKQSFSIQCRHLYHNRDEVTVVVVRHE